MRTPSISLQKNRGCALRSIAHATPVARRNPFAGALNANEHCPAGGKSGLAHRWERAPDQQCTLASGISLSNIQIERTMSLRANVITKDKLIELFHAVVNDTEQLLKSVATAGGEKAGALRAGAEQSLANAKERLHELQHAAVDQVDAASKSTDEYVHTHPWQAIGVAAGLTVVAGVVIGLLLNRH